MNFAANRRAHLRRRRHAPVTPSCTALYQENIRPRPISSTKYFAVELLKDDQGYVLGALVLDIAPASRWLIEAKTTLIATGGAGQLYRTITNALINTRRRHWHGAARRYSAAGYGVLPVPSHR